MVIILVAIRVIYDTENTTKSLSYVLLIIFLPVAGIIIYFSLGLNYRKNKLYSKKLIEDEQQSEKLFRSIQISSQQQFLAAGNQMNHSKRMARLLVEGAKSGLTSNNAVKLLLNGEQKFPEVMAAIRAAQHHIHIQYYIFEEDHIGTALLELLMYKAGTGVSVRFIYDDFGSHSIKNKTIDRLRASGVQVFPFYKVHFWLLANRLNYRNHRKIVIIDGVTSFLGGINVSDKYINTPGKQQLYWRDTHLRIDGTATHFLQYIFLCDWNFCADAHLAFEDGFFPEVFPHAGQRPCYVQIAASGPDSDTPTILYVLLEAINRAESEILITTPYFIPSESIMDALQVAALGGISIKLLVPGISDSRLVNSAAQSYYAGLLQYGVEIYLYQKGFIHAKTIVVDDNLAMIGTANMDYRSFDLNFEVNAVVYDQEMASALRTTFYDDLKDADKLDPVLWDNRSRYRKLLERIARLFAPVL